MSSTSFTSEQATDANRLISIIESIPKDKRPIITLMAESFINGMNAQEQLARSPDRTHQDAS